MRIGRIIGGIAVLAVGAVVAATAVLTSTDFNEYKGLLTREVEAATGRALTLGGPVDLELSLTPRLVVEDVAFANAAGLAEPEMLNARRIEAQVELLALIGGEVRVTRLVLVEPRVVLEVAPDGTGNWVMGTPSAAPPSGGSAAQLPTVSMVRIEDGTLVYRDRRSGAETRLDLARLDASADGLAGPLHIAVAGAVNATPFSLEGSLGAPRALVEGRPVEVDLTGQAGGAEVVLKGSIAEPAAGRGLILDVKAAGERLADLSALAGTPLPALGPYALSARLTDKGGTYRLDGMEGTLAGSDIAGTVAVNAGGPRPRIEADLTAQTIDIPALLPPSKDGDPGPAAKGPGRVIPDAPIPADALKAVDAKARLRIARLVLPGLVLDDVDARLALEDGRLALAPLVAGLAEGTLAGEARLDAAAKVPTLQLMAAGEKVMLGALAASLGAQVLDGGPAELELDLAGRGTTVRALAASLDGRVLLSVGQGRIHNDKLDLAGADLVTELVSGINPFVAKDPYTAMTCAVVRFDVADGVARTDKGLAMQTEKMNVIGTGTVNLGTEALDLAVRTEPREGLGLSAGGLTNLVQLEGTLAAPAVGLNPLEAGKTAASVGAAIATGGLSVLAQGLFSRVAADGTPCDTALGKAAPDGANPPADQPAAETSGETQGPGALIDGIGQGIKGLFGR